MKQKEGQKKNKTNNNQEMKNLCVTAPPYTHPKGEEKFWYYPRLIMHINELRRGIEMNFFFSKQNILWLSSPSNRK